MENIEAIDRMESYMRSFSFPYVDLIPLLREINPEDIEEETWKAVYVTPLLEEMYNGVTASNLLNQLKLVVPSVQLVPLFYQMNVLAQVFSTVLESCAMEGIEHPALILEDDKSALLSVLDELDCYLMDFVSLQDVTFNKKIDAVLEQMQNFKSQSFIDLNNVILNGASETNVVNAISVLSDYWNQYVSLEAGIPAFPDARVITSYYLSEVMLQVTELSKRDGRLSVQELAQIFSNRYSKYKALQYDYYLQNQKVYQYKKNIL